MAKAFPKTTKKLYTGTPKLVTYSSSLNNTARQPALSGIAENHFAFSPQLNNESRKVFRISIGMMVFFTKIQVILEPFFILTIVMRRDIIFF